MRELRFGNLNYNADVQAVVSFFERWGTVASCTLFVDTQTGNSPLPAGGIVLSPLRSLGKKHSGKGDVVFENHQSVQSLTYGLPKDDRGSFRLAAPCEIAHARRGETRRTLW